MNACVRESASMLMQSVLIFKENVIIIITNKAKKKNIVCSLQGGRVWIKLSAPFCSKTKMGEKPEASSDERERNEWAWSMREWVFETNELRVALD